MSPSSLAPPAASPLPYRRQKALLVGSDCSDTSSTDAVNLARAKHSEASTLETARIDERIPHGQFRRRLKTLILAGRLGTASAHPRGSRLTSPPNLALINSTDWIDNSHQERNGLACVGTLEWSRDLCRGEDRVSSPPSTSNLKSRSNGKRSPSMLPSSSATFRQDLAACKMPVWSAGLLARYLGERCMREHAALHVIRKADAFGPWLALPVSASRP